MKVIGVLVIVLAILAAACAAAGWLMMITIGIVHGDVLPAVHPVGFWVSVPLGVLVGALTNTSRTTGK
jgi:hypothetical protein